MQPAHRAIPTGRPRGQLCHVGEEAHGVVDGGATQDDTGTVLRGEPKNRAHWISRSKGLIHLCLIVSLVHKPRWTPQDFGVQNAPHFCTWFALKLPRNGGCKKGRGGGSESSMSNLEAKIPGYKRNTQKSPRKSSSHISAHFAFLVVELSLGRHGVGS